MWTFWLYKICRCEKSGRENFRSLKLKNATFLLSHK